MPGPTQHLFVYGTLRSAFANPMARLLRSNGRLVGGGVLDARLYDVGAYPAAVDAAPGGNGVVGDVFALLRPRLVLRAMDRYEGCGSGDPKPHLYSRAERAVRLDGGGSVAAWVYLYNRDTRSLPEIPDGDYLRHRLGKPRRRR